MPPTDNNGKKTRVDGIGLWRSWTRNFNTKILALLDLIDNSLDAAIHNGMNKEDQHSFRGKVHVYPDIYELPNGRATTTTTGLCIVNNSIKSIRPLKNVLEVYNSSKVNSGAGDIGENGVGLKQGCATLSDLSFVLMKNGSDANIELGIVAKDLQRSDGCYLPAFNFSNEKHAGSRSLRDQMISFFSKPSHADVAKCIAKYGAARADSERNLIVGIERLCRHFDRKAFDDPYVFMVILDKVHTDQTEEYVGNVVDAQQKMTVTRLLKDLADIIPRTYLHVPQSFSFVIGDKRMTFDYWPRRLIELTSLTVYVNKKIPWLNKHELPTHQNTYPLRVFLGFDGMRITDPSCGKEGSLYVYSRQSGRLISHHADARTRMGLQAGGTDYCQGLTVIIDDFGGNLPLNPTKQEVAFGEESHGSVHEENLMAWVGCVAQFYYQRHLSTLGNKKKTMTQELARFGDTLLDNRRQLKPLDDSNFTTYDLSFKASVKCIRVDKSSVEEFVGSDTLYRLLPKKEATAKVSKEAQGAKKRKAAPAVPAAPPLKKKARRPPTPSPPQPLPPPPQRQRQPVSYAEDESDSSDEMEKENGYDPPSPFDGDIPAPAEHNPRNSTRIHSAAVEGEPTRSEPSSQSEPTQSDFEALCRRLTAKLEVVNAENVAVREENNKLRNRIAALREEMNAHYAVRHENTALKEEVKSLRGNNAKLQLDHQRLEFLVNEKSRDEGRLS